MGPAGIRKRFGVHAVDIDFSMLNPVQQSGQFADVRSDDHLRRHMFRQQIQRSGIHYDRGHRMYAFVQLHGRPIGIGPFQRVMLQQRGNRLTLHILISRFVIAGGDARTDHPGLHAPFADNCLRQRRKHHILRMLRAHVTHHARIRTRRSPRRQYCRTGITGGTGHQPDHTTRILTVRKLGQTNRIRDEITVRHLRRGNRIVKVETKINQRQPATRIRGGRHHRTWLHRAERHRNISRNIRTRQRTVIHTHAGRRIDGHHQRQIRGRLIIRQGGTVRQPPAGARRPRLRKNRWCIRECRRRDRARVHVRRHARTLQRPLREGNGRRRSP